MKLNFVILLFVVCSGTSVFAQALPDSPFRAPPKFLQDVSRNAAWLPRDIRSLGLQAAYEQHWAALPSDIQQTLTRMQIPAWMIALVPINTSAQEEIFKQFRFMELLAGPPPSSRIGQRAEQLLIFGGSAQLATPGDVRTGLSLGAEGCTAAMAQFIIAELELEFPAELSGLPAALATTQSSGQMLSLMNTAARASAPAVEVFTRAFADLRADDITPGTLMIAQKPGGSHTFGWTRVPAGWNWADNDKMAVGNTGLPQFGDRMILAQEYITESTDSFEQTHNAHGPINSHNVVYAGRRAVLESPNTNVYAVKNSSFVIIRFN